MLCVRQRCVRVNIRIGFVTRKTSSVPFCFVRITRKVRVRVRVRKLCLFDQDEFAMSVRVRVRVRVRRSLRV